MDESKLKTTINYLQKGKKKSKQYDATVIEAFKEKYITVEVESVSDFPLKLKWDSFVYTATFFGNEISCQYKVEKDFTAKKITAESGQPSVIVKRKVSGRPESQQ